MPTPSDSNSDDHDETEDTRDLVDEHEHSNGWLDDGSGSGAQSSREDWVRDNHSPISHDGRGLTRTTFYPEDAPTSGPGQAHRETRQKRSWSDLAKWNDGMYSDISRGGQNFEADKHRWVDTFASQLECTSYQRDRTEWIIERLDMGPFMGARLPVECVILGVLTIVVDAEVRNFEDRSVERDDVQELVDNLDLEHEDLMQARRHLHKTASHLISPDKDGEL